MNWMTVNHVYSYAGGLWRKRGDDIRILVGVVRKRGGGGGGGGGIYLVSVLEFL